jgi:hypothetical protein
MQNYKTRLKLSYLLRLQIVYAAIALVFNATSVITFTIYGRLLTPTDPLLGSLVLVIYSSVIWLGYRQFITLYRIFMAFSVLIFGYGGVGVHLVQLIYSPDGYFSALSGILAICINMAGLILNCIAALGLYSENKT